jgi:hypothetical protein
MTAEATTKKAPEFFTGLEAIKPTVPRSAPLEVADQVAKERGFVSREADSILAPPAVTSAGSEPARKISLRQPGGEPVEQLNMRLYLKDINSFIEHARDMRLSYKDLFGDVWRYYQQNKLDKAEG